MTEKKFFAAANTVDGFKSYYAEIFGKCDRIYVIKGGSGTGKSRFMHECADALGEGHEVEYFYCSFDPESLDGIIIDGEIAIIDGTAPHVYEPTVPGAREDIVDLGAFWDSARLLASRKTLEELIIKKKSCFERAYSYLGACGRLDRVRQRVVAEYIDRDRLSAAAAKLVSEASTEKGERRVRIISALGREGIVRHDTFERNAEKVLRIYDGEGAAHLLLERIVAESERFNIPICVSYDPLFAQRPNAVLVGKIAVIATDRADDETMHSYFQSGFSAEAERILRINEIQSTLIDEAISEFHRAAEVHFGIEEIYVEAMDFGKKEEFTREFIAKLKK